ncbi:hypothetical protein PoMZ_10816 [Pyricularia oryzae]|uniref:Uncharacterized protein n=1 Tax=Pyricularia oryzae TaxID=318829 RepID=A0A4P7N552_PYROR|nr:hypothetical protein PoMZ_10816 [Pyricularia oryzae]
MCTRAAIWSSGYISARLDSDACEYETADPRLGRDSRYVQSALASPEVDPPTALPPNNRRLLSPTLYTNHAMARL